MLKMAMMEVRIAVAMVMFAGGPSHLPAPSSVSVSGHPLAGAAVGDGSVVISLVVAAVDEGSVVVSLAVAAVDDGSEVVSLVDVVVDEGGVVVSLVDVAGDDSVSVSLFRVDVVCDVGYGPTSSSDEYDVGSGRIDTSSVLVEYVLVL